MRGLDASYEDASRRFVDAAVDEPSEIKLSGAVFGVNFEPPICVRNARAVWRGQKLET